MKTMTTMTTPVPFINRLILFGILFTVFLSPCTTAQTIESDFVEGKIWLKLKPNQPIPHTISPTSGEIKTSDVPVISRIASLYNLKSIKSPFHQSGSDDISRIISIEFNDHGKVNELLEQLANSGIAEYVEREPTDHACFIPNDPGYSSQWALTKINAPAAWDISTGSANIVVAIVDEGVHTAHPDLQPNIWVNAGEIPGDGIDNDNNGYIDDVNGYDVSDGDNNPIPPNSFTHGTHVAGIVSAKSNNGIGVASIGSNIKLMCVKIAPDVSNSVLTGGTAGIYYAALNNARIINCSFGTASYSTTRQAIIDWAYKTRGAIVVSVAGNSGLNNKVYPGAMNNVVCVTATNSSDTKESTSTYGSWVDVSAPGTSIYSTLPANTYGNNTGTSMAAPAVSGLLGLILSVNPNLTQLEAINCLKSTTTNIDALNPSYAGMLGTGRIDALAALQCAQGTVFSLNASPIGLSSGTTCSVTTAMQVVVRNVGTTTLTTLNVNYKIDNNTPAVYNWAGSLASGFATVITLPATAFTYGKHTFIAYTSAPNAGIDGNITNDTIKSILNVVQTGTALPFTEGFEGTFPPTDWGLSNPDGEITWAPTTVAKYSGSRSALILNYFDPFVRTTDYMTTPVLDLTTASSPTLTFQVAYQLQTGFPTDTLLVLASADCGKTFWIIYKNWGSALSTVAGTTTAAFIPANATQWRKETIPIPGAVVSATSMFVFMNKGNAGNNLYMDDINISGTSISAAVAVVQTAGTNPVCAGESVTFTAAPTNGGTTPSYQWKVNSVNAGTNSATFTTTTLTNGQVVTCEMTSNLSGVTGSPATSNSITMTVNPSVTPAASVSVTTGTNPACAGSSVTFTAAPTNGGTTPTYQWKVNGVNAGSNSSTFTASALTNGQIVTCELTSNAACASPATATSTGITMTVNPIPATPVITQNGSILTSSSATGNQWYLNGNPIMGATNQTHTVAQNGSYTVVVTTNSCSSSASSPVIMSTVSIGESTNQSLLTIYPNPGDGNFGVLFNATNRSNYIVELKNAMGQLVYREVLTDFSGTYSKQLNVTEFGKGVYFFGLTTGKNEIVKMVMVY